MGNPFSKVNSAASKGAEAIQELSKHANPAIDTIKSSVETITPVVKETAAHAIPTLDAVKKTTETLTPTIDVTAKQIGNAAESVSGLADVATTAVPIMTGGIVLSSLAAGWQSFKVGQAVNMLEKEQLKMNFRYMESIWNTLYYILLSKVEFYTQIAVVVQDKSTLDYFRGACSKSDIKNKVAFTNNLGIKILNSPEKSGLIYFFSCIELTIPEFSLQIEKFSLNERYHIEGSTAEGHNLVTIQQVNLDFNELEFNWDATDQPLRAQYIDVNSIDSRLLKDSYQLALKETNKKGHSLLHSVCDLMGTSNEDKMKNYLNERIKTFFYEGKIPSISL